MNITTGSESAIEHRDPAQVRFERDMQMAKLTPDLMAYRPNVEPTSNIFNDTVPDTVDGQNRVLTTNQPGNDAQRMNGIYDAPKTNTESIGSQITSMDQSDATVDKEKPINANLDAPPPEATRAMMRDRMEGGKEDGAATITQKGSQESAGANLNGELKEAKSGLSTGAIVGITLGVIFGVILVVVFVMRYKKALKGPMRDAPFSSPYQRRPLSFGRQRHIDGYDS